MNNSEFIQNIENVNEIVSTIELAFEILFAYYFYIKIINIRKVSNKNIVICIISCVVIDIITRKVKYYISSYHSLLILIFLVSLINKINFKKDLMYSISISIISLVISYVIYIISVTIAFVPNVLFNISNDYISAITIITIYEMLVFWIVKMKKFKHGINFLQRELKNSHYSILVIQLCIIILFLKTYIINIQHEEAKDITITIIIFSLYMFITIKEFIQLYYKQNLLVKDLEQTKSELESKKQEIAKLEKENLEFSKKSHSLAHKQKVLEYKLNQLMNDNNKNIEESNIKQELENISKELYKEPKEIDLPKTDIASIDNMLSYMQSECIKNNIKFELQVVGNIHYMVNNLISENDLEILIADHLKDAIIAINYSDNSNRSIMVRIGKIDNLYSLYIYDSGIEFTKEVLDKIGKEPITTHADNGGTGMGFMNTFDTLNKCKASLIIQEIGAPCADNYTKVLIFKFDNMNEFKTISYKTI